MRPDALIREPSNQSISATRPPGRGAVIRSPRSEIAIPPPPGRLGKYLRFVRAWGGWGLFQELLQVRREAAAAAAAAARVGFTAGRRPWKSRCVRDERYGRLIGRRPA